MDYKEKIQILRACSSKKGNRCSSCPAFGQGDRNCSRNAMKAAATAISTLQAENEKLRAEVESLKKGHSALSWPLRLLSMSDASCQSSFWPRHSGLHSFVPPRS